MTSQPPAYSEKQGVDGPYVPETTQYTAQYSTPAPQPQFATSGPQPPPAPPQMQPVFVPYQAQQEKKTLEKIKAFIPQLPVCVAVTSLVLNCIIPGLGTIFASFGTLCCADTKEIKRGRFGLFCINFWSGIGQLILIPFGIGWVWSVWWGMLMLHASKAINLEEQTYVSTVPTVVSSTTAYPRQPTQTATVY